MAVRCDPWRSADERQHQTQLIAALTQLACASSDPLLKALLHTAGLRQLYGAFLSGSNAAYSHD
jgi:hypothetical protein